MQDFEGSEKEEGQTLIGEPIQMRDIRASLTN
jgi:hypothetical protein